MGREGGRGEVGGAMNNFGGVAIKQQQDLKSTAQLKSTKKRSVKTATKKEEKVMNERKGKCFGELFGSFHCFLVVWGQGSVLACVFTYVSLEAIVYFLKQVCFVEVEMRTGKTKKRKRKRERGKSELSLRHTGRQETAKKKEKGRWERDRRIGSTCSKIS